MENVTKGINGSLHSNLPSDIETMEDTVEYRLMMAYSQRRRPPKVDRTKEKGSVADQTPSPTPEKTEREEGRKRRKKKKNIWRRLKPILRCVKPQTEEPEPTQTPTDENGPMFRCFVQEHTEDERHGSAEDEDELGEVATRVIGIANELQFTSQVESDSEDTDKPELNDLEKVIGLLLRENGDRINEEFNLAHIAADLFFDYNFFTRLLNTFLVRIGYRTSNSDSLGPQAANKTQIAAACEVTSRLTSVEALPRTRLLQHGARYLQEYYSSWVQEQGGYEVAFQDEEEVD